MKEDEYYEKKLVEDKEYYQAKLKADNERNRLISKQIIAILIGAFLTILTYILVNVI